MEGYQQTRIVEYDRMHNSVFYQKIESDQKIIFLPIPPLCLGFERAQKNLKPAGKSWPLHQTKEIGS
jgi:hypothetical protein